MHLQSMPSWTNSSTVLTRGSSTFYMFGLNMIDHALFVSCRIVTALTLPSTRIVLVHQSKDFPVQTIYILTMVSGFVYHERISCIAKLCTNRTRETFSIYVLGLYMGLDMRNLFRIVTTLRTLPLIFFIFEHHTFDHVIQLIIKRRTHSTLKSRLFQIKNY